MLNEVNSFIYEMESIYLKELNPNIVLNFMEKFYNDFLKNNNDQKTANAIIICGDTIMLQKSVIKDKWIYKTGENYILNQNRGNETFDKLVKDILDGYVPNIDVLRIVQMFFAMGVDSDYKISFLQMTKERTLENMNIESNLMTSSFNKLKKPAYRFLYICVSCTLLCLFFTEIYYFISLQSTVKSSLLILNNIRSTYVL